MKKATLLITLFTASFGAIHAQTSQSAVVTVNVSDLKTITINSGATPGFVLATNADYNSVVSTAGLSAGTTTNITVVSRGGYKIKAALNANLTNASGTNGVLTIPGSKLGISVTGVAIQTGETTPTVKSTNTVFTDGGGTIADIVKTTSTGNAGGTLGTSFNVNYKLGNFPQVVNLATGSFTANIVYTIEAN